MSCSTFSNRSILLWLSTWGKGTNEGEGNKPYSTPAPRHLLPQLFASSRLLQSRTQSPLKIVELLFRPLTRCNGCTAIKPEALLDHTERLPCRLRKRPAAPKLARSRQRAPVSLSPCSFILSPIRITLFRSYKTRPVVGASLRNVGPILLFPQRRGSFS